MGRVHKRKPGSRRYADYSQEALDECLDAIKNGNLSWRKASTHYNIPFRTIANKLKGNHLQSPGKPPVFSKEEEDAFVRYTEVMGSFGFPLSADDLRYVAKSYLDRIGRSVSRFSNNMPGKEWTRSFLQRHPQLSERFAANIKKSRAAVDEKTINEYIDNLKIVLQDVPPNMIWNYDETNISDNPGQKKVLVRRGVKYPERICNFSKSSTSVMFCGNAAGDMLPPYVVYKAGQKWTTWTEGGPDGCRYNNSSSGWFDAATFGDWFDTILVPKLRRMAGKKVVIGDNLASHLSMNILEKCREEDIYFVCLPPNSTHLTQPLDVAVYRPLKVAWRKVLSDWKGTKEGMQHGVLPKHRLPSLLRKTLANLAPNMAHNLQSGFQKCGIVPCDKEPLLQRLPSRGVDEAVSAAFFEVVKNTRIACTTNESNIRRRRKIDVPAGKSVAHEEIVQQEPAPPRSSTVSKKRRQEKNNSESEEEHDAVPLCQDSSEEENWESYSQKQLEAIEQEEISEPDDPSFLPIKRQVGAFVIIRYENDLYPGVIESCNKEGAEVSAMKKSLKSWKWPDQNDKLFYEWKDVIGGINPPKRLSKRGFFRIPELEDRS